MGILAGLKKLLGFESVIESATKIVDRIAGTDWTPTQKADFIINYQNATKHQSLPRRCIALAVTFVWLLCVFIWLFATVWLNVAGAAAESGELITGSAAWAIGLQADIEGFIANQIDKPFNIVIGFYFLTQMIKR